MATQGNGAGPPTVGNVPAAPMADQIIANMTGAPVVAPAAGHLIANLAAPLVGPVVMAPPAGPNIAILAAPVVAPPAGPNSNANLGRILVAPDDPFDIAAGLLGSPPRKSNIGCEIHAWIDEE